VKAGFGGFIQRNANNPIITIPKIINIHPMIILFPIGEGGG